MKCTPILPSVFQNMSAIERHIKSALCYQFNRSYDTDDTRADIFYDRFFSDGIALAIEFDGVFFHQYPSRDNLKNTKLYEVARVIRLRHGDLQPLVPHDRLICIKVKDEVEDCVLQTFKALSLSKWPGVWNMKFPILPDADISSTHVKSYLGNNYGKLCDIFGSDYLQEDGLSIKNPELIISNAERYPHFKQMTVGTLGQDSTRREIRTEQLRLLKILSNKNLQLIYNELAEFWTECEIVMVTIFTKSLQEIQNIKSLVQKYWTTEEIREHQNAFRGPFCRLKEKIDYTLSKGLKVRDISFKHYITGNILEKIKSRVEKRVTLNERENELQRLLGHRYKHIENHSVESKLAWFELFDTHPFLIPLIEDILWHKTNFQICAKISDALKHVPQEDICSGLKARKTKRPLIFVKSVGFLDDPDVEFLREEFKLSHTDVLFANDNILGNPQQERFIFESLKKLGASDRDISISSLRCIKPHMIDSIMQFVGDSEIFSGEFSLTKLETIYERIQKLSNRSRSEVKTQTMTFMNSLNPDEFCMFLLKNTELFETFEKNNIKRQKCINDES